VGFCSIIVDSVSPSNFFKSLAALGGVAGVFVIVKIFDRLQVYCALIERESSLAKLIATFFCHYDAKERQSFDCKLRAGLHHLDYIEQMNFTQVEQVTLYFYWAYGEIQAFGDASDRDFNFLAQILELFL